MSASSHQNYKLTKLTLSRTEPSADSSLQTRSFSAMSSGNDSFSLSAPFACVLLGPDATVGACMSFILRPIGNVSKLVDTQWTHGREMMKVCLLDGGANVRVWRRDAFCPSLASNARELGPVKITCMRHLLEALTHSECHPQASHKSHFISLTLECPAQRLSVLLLSVSPDPLLSGLNYSLLFFPAVQRLVAES